MDALLMIPLYRILEHLTSQIALDTSWIAQTYPGDTWKGRLAVSLNAEDHFRLELRGRCSNRLLLSSPYLKAARSEQKTTCQQSGKEHKNPLFHGSLSFHL